MKLPESNNIGAQREFNAFFLRHFKQLPNDEKVCTKHRQEAVVGPVHGSLPPGYYGAFLPLEVSLYACCEAAIDNVELAIGKVLRS